jgi:hypothetical protein
LHGVVSFGCSQSGATPLLFPRSSYARASAILPETRYGLSVSPRTH